MQNEIAERAQEITNAALPLMDKLGIPKADHADVLLAAAEMYADPENAEAVGDLSEPANMMALLAEAWECLNATEADVPAEPQ